MTGLVQTHAAPDLVTFDKDKVEAVELPSGERDVVRVGTVKVPIIKLGDTTIALTRADLRSLVKEAYIAGWNGKAIHRADLIAKLTAEIGS